MRLFAALPLPDTAREELADLLRQLRAERWPVRWVDARGAHLTLKFYGEVLPGRLEVILEAVTHAVNGAGRMAMCFTTLDAFPTARQPRVLYLGVEAPPALELLKDRVERASEQIGFAPEGVPFRAHVTLGRLRDGQRIPPGAIEQYRVTTPWSAFQVSQAVVYESVLTPAGPRYSPRLTVELGA